MSGSRANFSAAVKRERMKRQRNRCAKFSACHTMLYDTKLKIGSKAKGYANARYDHKIPRNWENTLANCQALCGNCHDKKSDNEAGSRTRRKNSRVSQRVRRAREVQSTSRSRKEVDKWTKIKLN